MNSVLSFYMEDTKQGTRGKCVEDAKQGTRKKSVELSQVIRNLTGVEQEQEKKSVLQQLLEPKQVEDSQRDREKAAAIARRIARGKSVSPAEKSFLMKVDPMLAQLAELARKEYERIKHALSQASTREEQQNIIHQAYQMVIQVSKSNEQFGMLLGEAVKEAVQETQKKASKTSTASEGACRTVLEAAGRTALQNPSSIEQPNLSEADGQQALLEHFFPEEWMSVLDCRG